MLDNPKRNTLEYLEPRVTELNKLSDEELKKLAPDLNEEEAQRKQQIIKELKRVE